MTNLLNGMTEGRLLNELTINEHFILKAELINIYIKPGTKVLVAGCGPGNLCRFIESKFSGIEVSGCDVNSQFLDHARIQTLRPQTKYFEHDILEKPFKENYNFIFNRLMTHSLDDEQLSKLIKNIYEGLSNGGQVCLIDIDGPLPKLGTENPELLRSLELMNTAYSSRHRAVSMIASLLKRTGFVNLESRVDSMDFKGLAKSQEINLWKEKFENSLGFYGNLLGNEFEAKKVFKLYFDEAEKETVPMFYNKFIIEAGK